MIKAAINTLVAGSAKSREELSGLSKNISSNTRVHKPSDDPYNYARSLRVQAEISRSGALMSTVDSAMLSLQTQESALGVVEDKLKTVVERMVQGSNFTASPEDMKNMAEELRGLKAGIVSQANTRNIDGTFVFGGGSRTPAFTQDAAGVVSYTGSSSGLTVEAESDSYTISTVGSEVFNAGGDLFARLDEVIGFLDAGDRASVSSRLNVIQDSLEGVTLSRTKVGLSMQRAEKQADLLTDGQMRMKLEKGALTDNDMAKDISRLNQVQSQVEASYLAISKLDGLSLFNYMR